MRVQFLRRQPIEKLKISLASSFGGSGFVDALTQAVKRHLEPFAIEPTDYPQGIFNSLTGNEPGGQAASQRVARKEFLGTFALGKVEQEGTKHVVQCSASRNFSASMAAMQPDHAAVMACR